VPDHARRGGQRAPDARVARPDVLEHELRARHRGPFEALGDHGVPEPFLRNLAMLAGNMGALALMDREEKAKDVAPTPDKNLAEDFVDPTLLEAEPDGQPAQLDGIDYEPPAAATPQPLAPSPSPPSP